MVKVITSWGSSLSKACSIAWVMPPIILSARVRSILRRTLQRRMISAHPSSPKRESATAAASPLAMKR